MKDVEKDLSAFYTRLEEFGWEIFTESTPRYNMDWTLPLSIIYVWEKIVAVDMDTINDSLGVLNPFNAAFEERIQVLDLEWAFKVLEPKGWVVKMKLYSVKVTKRTYFSIES